MLIRFKVGNFLSFDGIQEFSMISGKTEAHKNHIKECKDFGILRLSAMYGANASGKSNFIKALVTMKNLIIRGDSIVTDKYHRSKLANKNKPSLFEVELELDGHLYSYGLEYLISKQEIVDEWLYELFTDKDSISIFQRNGVLISHSFTGEDKQRVDIYAEDAASHPQKTFLNTMGSRVRPDDEGLKVFSLINGWFHTKLIIMDSFVPFIAGRVLNDDYFVRLNS